MSGLHIHILLNRLNFLPPRNLPLPAVLSSYKQNKHGEHTLYLLNSKTSVSVCTVTVFRLKCLHLVLV